MRAFAPDSRHGLRAIFEEKIAFNRVLGLQIVQLRPDKVIGRMLLDERLPLRDAVLVVSGRTSYEIVQKAWLAGIEIISAVSAPSSLAIELADTAGITLIGFARGHGFNIYTHPNRIQR